MASKSICFYLSFLILIICLFTALSGVINLAANVEKASTSELMGINLNQTADMKLAFLGVPPEYINQTQLMPLLPQTFYQFAYPNTISWALNFSFVFSQFPSNISDLLRNNAFHSGGSAYFNITLLDFLLSQLDDLTIPKRGYLLVFMWIPNATDHSWFYVQERPDLFLDRTDYFNNVPSKSWIFPPNFGGIRRTLYFDVSSAMEQLPTESLVTGNVANLINNGLEDIFRNLLGATDSRMIAADTQRYQNYTVKILWINGTGEQLPLGKIKTAFEDLMPWTNWNVTIETRPSDNTLNDFIESHTEELSTPLNTTLLLSNGTSFTIEAQRNVVWNPLENAGENDPVNCYFFNQVKNYFNLADLADKSIIPVILLQLSNDTAFGGSAEAGVSWFPHNVIIIGAQGSAITGWGEAGPLLLVHLLRHEIGHWVSLNHHSSNYGQNYPKIICSMRSVTNEFCAFCKDARRRISFISYYNAAIVLLSKNLTKATVLESELNNTLQSFYDWDYAKAVETIAPVYFALDTPPLNVINVSQTPSPDNVTPEDPVKVNATVTDDIGGVRTVILNYTNQNGTWTAINMTNVEENIWNATIPASQYGTSVTYIIIAEDNLNNTITTQEMGLEYQYQVAPELQTILGPLILIVATMLVAMVHKRRPTVTHVPFSS